MSFRHQLTMTAGNAFDESYLNPYSDVIQMLLFEPLGISSAVIERDASGSFVGSSFMLATARDWARLGQIYVQDGVWKGERLLPEGWVELSRTPGAHNAAGLFGAHFWLPGQVSSDLDDAIHAVGHDKQYVSIVPSRALVVVRLGLTRSREGWSQAEFLRRIVERL